MLSQIQLSSVDVGRAFDAAAAGRHVDHPHFDPAAGAVAHRRGESQRDALDARGGSAVAVLLPEP